MPKASPATPSQNMHDGMRLTNERSEHTRQPELQLLDERHTLGLSGLMASALQSTGSKYIAAMRLAAKGITVPH